MDFSTIKNELFPVVASVFSRTNSLGIKIRGLEALVILCGGSANENIELSDGLDGTGVSKPSKPNGSSILDKYTVQEKVIPLLKAIKTKEPAVMMAALAVFQQVGKITDADFLAIEVLPMLWNFSLGPLLNLEQFHNYMNLIKNLSSKVEQEQIRKLRDLSSNPNGTLETSRSNDLMGPGNSNGLYGSNSGSNVVVNEFERLVLGKLNTNGDDMLRQSLRPELQRAQSIRTEPTVFAWSTPALNPSSNPSSRAITPDQSLNNFATLKPSSNNIMGNSTTSTNSLTPFAPMQLPVHTSAWAFNTSTNSALPPLQQAQPQHSFSIRPPMAKSPFSAFSIAPPPAHSQRLNAQASSSGGSTDFGNTNSSMNSVRSSQQQQQQQQKSGLDAYESLI